jgi:hypothetical protein
MFPKPRVGFRNPFAVEGRNAACAESASGRRHLLGGPAAGLGK